LRQQFLTQGHSFGPHGLKQIIDAGFLFGGETELVGKLKHMDWTGVAVQLTGERKAHPAPTLEVSDLLFG
jgi:hypothetical protein